MERMPKTHEKKPLKKSVLKNAHGCETDSHANKCCVRRFVVPKMPIVAKRIHMQMKVVLANYSFAVCIHIWFTIHE